MQVKRRRKHRYAAPLGGAFVLLAVIGIITVVAASLRLTFQFLDNKAEKEMFEELIKPVQMWNPVPFESPQDIPMDNLLLYSMWATLAEDRAINYEYGDNQALLVPASDLDVSAARLFGSEIQLEHRNFGDFEASYQYDEESNMYNVRMIAQLYLYEPSITEITKDGNYYNLWVDYISPPNAWSSTFAGGRTANEGEKTMVYVVEKDGDAYHLVKLLDPPIGGAEGLQQQAGEASQEETAGTAE